MTAENIISVDIEADGPIPGDYSMLSFGAVSIANPKTSIYVEFKPITDNFAPEALAVSGIDREALKVTGETPNVGLIAIEEWLQGISKPIFTGNNAPFDWMFTCWYFHHYLGRNPFGHAALDMRSYAMGALDTSWSDSSLKKLPLSLRLEVLNHNALGDAKAQGDCFKRVRSWRGRHDSAIWSSARPHDVLDMD